MNRYADPLEDHVDVLRRLRRCGGDVYARALGAARVAVARVVLAEAERLAGVERAKSGGAVVRFPRPFRGESEDGDGDS